MSGDITVKSYGTPPFNKNEAIRYMRGRNGEQTDKILSECYTEVSENLSYRVVYKEFPIIRSGNILDIGFCQTESKDLSKNLKACERVVVFAATVGLGADRIIEKYNRISPLKALVVDALCSERIESLCDLFNAEITENTEKNGYFTAPRFSVGYGDLKIELQKDILQSLDAERKLGITLSSGFLMMPTKSVTGIIGIGKEKCNVKSGCELCKNYTCEFRRK